MEWENTYRETRGFCLAAVQFLPEGDAAKQIVRQAERMNRFYGLLAAEAEKYAGICQTENPLSGYTCRMEAAAEGEELLVTVRLSLRIPGMVSRRKCVVHRWRDGFLVQERIV